ncbi:hypothetical protein ABEB36_015003 [Hypothenemus hampei]|uniref:Myb/SANT-like DNA-binding domain-containing protein n=1 Tax=Hypothenemus hampei TaxID=57062 RepID=A0ABD1E499_HYPHA
MAFIYLFFFSPNKVLVHSYKFLIFNTVNLNNPILSSLDQNCSDDQERGQDNTTTKNYTLWNVNATKQLIDLYEKQKINLKSFKIKNVKAMWEIIAQELSTLTNGNYSKTACENKWKVLERNYRKYVEVVGLLNTPKKWKKFMEKKSINPELVLGTTVHIPSDFEDTHNEDPDENMTSSSQQNEQAKEKKGVEKRRSNLHRRKTVLEKIREDRKEYQEKRLKQEQEKIELIKKRNEILQIKYCKSTTDHEC